MTCTTCHGALRPDAAFCPHCGQKQAPAVPSSASRAADALWTSPGAAPPPPERWAPADTDDTVLRSRPEAADATPPPVVPPRPGPSPSPPPSFESPRPAVPGASSGPSVSGSLLSRARRGEEAALETMFRQFVDEDEQVLTAAYLGKMGFLFATDSFGCVTDRRVATIRSGSFGELLYQDGYLDEINSTVVHQPAIWMLYVVFGLYVLLALFVAAPLSVFEPLFGMFVFAILLVPGLLIPRIYYRVVKSGLVTVIREGVSVYMFADRQRLAKANELLRTISSYRERRVARFHSR